ncbi:MAG: prephenate dehydratase [Puniceicoccales bacterium]|jgi:chorismate mutase/prephenate dehydratase|nr:prephenate dehydratase [Puniceicoccales bacterium]
MNLDDFRAEIDRIDRDIIRLLESRQQLVAKISEQKRASGVGAYVPAREEAMLANLERIAPASLPRPALRAIYREIISLSVGTQMGRPVAYLGPEGTYTQQAARKNFGSNVELSPMRTIPDVFAAVEHGEAAYGVIPVENSTDGAIVHSLDMLAETELKIIAQVYLNIEHCLIGRGPLSAVRRVLSKDTAIAQCRGWLQRNLPASEMEAVDSTAAAVRRASEDASCAAIASAIAATLYDVPILVQGIQDKKDNATRFLVIGSQTTPPSMICEEKTSLVLSLKHEPGSLQKALTPLSENGLNLTRIESRPNRRKAWEYLFFIDVIGHWEDPRLQTALRKITDACHFVKWLGSYPNTTP